MITRPTDNPLSTLNEDYKYASVHLIWNWDKGSKKSSLVFGRIVLLPTEFPKPEEEQRSEQRLCSGDNTLYSQEVTLPANDAVAFYQQLRANSGQKLEVPFILIKNQPICLTLPQFCEEPPWPCLATVFSGERFGKVKIPFIESWHGQPRLHHLVVDNCAFGWSDSEKLKAAEWLSEKLSFSWLDHDEFWGSCNLIALDPLFRSISERLLHPDGTSTGESAQFTFVLRSNKTYEEAKLLVVEKRQTGFGRTWETEINSNNIVVDFGHELDTYYYTVVSDKRGVLAHSSETHFIRNFSLDMVMMGRKLVVNDNSGKQVLEVEKHAEPLKTGYRDNNTVPAGRKLFLEAGQKHKAKEDEVRYGQKWFMNEKTEARDVIMQILGPAKKRAWIVDPYFARDDILYLLGVRNTHTPITVLTSAEYLKEHVDLPNTQDKIRGELLREELDRLASELSSIINPLAIRVMLGGKSPIHDRFIVIDDDIWHLGSSLNALGKRGTLIAKVPYPVPVLEVLTELMSDDAKSLLLEHWLTKGANSNAEDSFEN